MFYLSRTQIDFLLLILKPQQNQASKDFFFLLLSPFSLLFPLFHSLCSLFIEHSFRKLFWQTGHPSFFRNEVRDCIAPYDLSDDLYQVFSPSLWASNYPVAHDSSLSSLNFFVCFFLIAVGWGACSSSYSSAHSARYLVSITGLYLA